MRSQCCKMRIWGENTIMKKRIRNIILLIILFIFLQRIGIIPYSEMLVKLHFYMHYPMYDSIVKEICENGKMVSDSFAAQYVKFTGNYTEIENLGDGNNHRVYFEMCFLFNNYKRKVCGVMYSESDQDFAVVGNDDLVSLKKISSNWYVVYFKENMSKY